MSLAGALALVQTASTAIQNLPFHDSFSYAEGNLYAVASGVWDAGGNSGPELTILDTATLTAPAGLAAAKAPRQPDGSLPAGFARLVAGSDLIDQGVEVGQPFNSTAPDLGAFEF